MLGMLILGIIVIAPTSDAAGGWPVRFEVDRVILVTSSGRHEFTVEMAVTWEQRAQGLQQRPSLPANHGMLFDFRRSEPVSMWMKNTLISLDMLFIGADGRIVNIAENTRPLSLELIPSAGPVRGVLELDAGTSRRLGVKPGDRVLHAIFAMD
jgi:uncharacterized protein